MCDKGDKYVSMQRHVMQLAVTEHFILNRLHAHYDLETNRHFNNMSQKCIAVQWFDFCCRKINQLQDTIVYH